MDHRLSEPPVYVSDGWASMADDIVNPTWIVWSSTVVGNLVKRHLGIESASSRGNVTWKVTMCLLTWGRRSRMKTRS